MVNKLLFIVLFFHSFIILSQIRINEYSVSNSSLNGGATFADNTGGSPDWIELYNSGAASVSMTGWMLTDNPNKPPKYSFPGSVSIAAGSYLRVWCSGKGSPSNASGHIHTNFKLTQCAGDWIILMNGNTIVDSLQLRKTQATHSRGRFPDGSATWKIFTSPTPNASNSGSSYSEYAPTPIFNVAPGFYGGAQNITLSVNPNSGISIHYTTNGSEPTTASAVYSNSPISISSTGVVRAIAISSNTSILPGFIETNTYFINETIDQRYGVVSISGGNQLDDLMDGNQIEPKTHMEYFEKNLFVTEAYGLSNKHGNDSWAFDQRGIDIEVKDDYGYNNAFKHKFFDDWKLGKSKRKEFQTFILKAGASDNFPGDNTVECHMRDAFAQTYAFRKNLELDGRRSKQVITFVNGKYWGVYELRERFDEDYMDFYYDQPKDSVDNLAYWGSLQIRNGSDTGWVNLYNYVMANSMTNVANYNYVESKLNFKSLIDYMVYNSYLVNSDFINWNSAWWRGRAANGDKKKWRYWMWDMDNIYDLGENFSGLPTTGMDADPCDYENIFEDAGPNEGHPDILAKLMTNPNFKSMYINRYADLLNTAFKCDSIMDHFNYFRNILTPEMPRHIGKWGGDIADWNKNMDTLKSKIQQRCSYIEQKIKDCYSVTGPHQITVDVQPPGAGEVKLNTIWLPNYIWSGKYFGGVTLNFIANTIDTANFEFERWEFKNHNPSLSTTEDSVTVSLTTGDDVVAYFREKNSDVIYPTAFTPNGDGNNDVLFPLGATHIKSFKVEIWNRWGQLVYSSTDTSKGWDGNFQGSPAQTGVYAYILKYTNYADEEKVKKGNITLIR
jgi:gliding motility-associated-like protein